MIPAASSIGDEIAIFAGTATPFVIRRLYLTSVENPTDGVDAQLIGDAYVHEMMDGEVLKRGDSLQEIRLL